MTGRDGAKGSQARRGGERGRGRDGAQASDRAAPSPEFSRPLRVSALGAGGERLRAAADAQERRALARRFGVPEVRRLEVDAQVDPVGDGWRVAGVARARLVQTCVVTLEPVVQTLEERFSRLLEPGAPPPDLVDLDPDEAEDPPEPLGDAIDPAEMASEAVALAIDPYPRSPEADFSGAGARPAGAEPIDETARRPFASLAALRDRLEAASPDGPEADDPEAPDAPDRGKDP